MDHLFVVAPVLFFVLAALSNGKLITDRVKNACGVLVATGLITLIIGVSQYLEQNMDNVQFWSQWCVGSFVGALVLYAAAFWAHARFELPASRHASK